jgi:transcription elongation factor Elf1
VNINRKARCPHCGSRQVKDTGFTHNDERTLECGACGEHFEESDA